MMKGSAVALVAALAALGLGCGASPAALVVKLDPYADDSIRIRVAPAAAGITEPPLQALCNCTPAASVSAAAHQAVSGDGVTSLTNGNLKVDVDPATGLLTATRVSDGKVLLKQTALTFAKPNVPTTRAGSVSALVSFAGTAAEKVYGQSHPAPRPLSP